MSGGAAVGWSVFGVVVVLIFVLCFLLVAYYSDPEDTSTTLTKLIGSLALTVCLLATLLIPVDVFIVSSDKIDADIIGVKSLYIIFYGVVLVSLFGLLPFGYFYYEEEEGPEENLRNAEKKMSISSPASSPRETDATRKAKQACRALKYTIMFLIVMILLLIIGIVISNGGPNTSAAPVVQKMDKYFESKDVILAFCIACLTVVGMVGWITYTAYGMAFLPVLLFPTRKNTPESDSKKFSAEDLDAKILKVDSRLQFFLAKGFKTQADEGTIRDLKVEKRKLEQLARAKKSPDSRTDNSSWGKKFCASAVWPFRFIFSILSLVLGLLVVVSLSISLFDRGLNSPCGIKCGFLLGTPTIANPLSVIQMSLVKFFPADYIFFSVLVLFFFACSLAGLLGGGVRLFCLKLYDIKARKTMQNALLAGIWLLCFVLVAINVFVADLLSQYTSFGDQHDPQGRLCSFESSATHCVPTQISILITGLESKLPVFGVIFFFSQVLFVLSYICIGMYSLHKCKNRLQETEGYDILSVDDDDDLKV